jgi:hypothetical protein
MSTSFWKIITEDMQIYIGDQARVLFDSETIPNNSIGVFLHKVDGWVYWFSDKWYFDSGSAESEIDALRKAKDNLK